MSAQSQKVFSLWMRPKWKFEIKQTFKWCPKTLRFCLSHFRCVHLPVSRFCNKWTTHCTEMGFTSFTSSGFPTTVVFRRKVNERKNFNTHHLKVLYCLNFHLKWPFLFHLFAKTKQIFTSKKRKNRNNIFYLVIWFCSYTGTTDSQSLFSKIRNFWAWADK